MKKRALRLNLNRETLRVLEARQISADGAGNWSMYPSCLVFQNQASGCICYTQDSYYCESAALCP